MGDKMSPEWKKRTTIAIAALLNGEKLKDIIVQQAAEIAGDKLKDASGARILDTEARQHIENALEHIDIVIDKTDESLVFKECRQARAELEAVIK